jgi:hypothetical protein
LTLSETRFTLPRVFRSSSRRALAAALAALLYPLGLSAAEDTVWRSPDTCPAPAELRAPPQGTSRLWIDVEQTASDWRATIHAEYAGGAGSRELSGHSCEELTRAVLVALSLIAPEVLLAPATQSEPPAPVSETALPEDKTESVSSRSPTASAPERPLAESSPRLGPKRQRSPEPKPAPRPEAGDKPEVVTPGSLSSKRVELITELGLGVALQDLVTPMFGGVLELDVAWRSWSLRSGIMGRSTLGSVSLEQSTQVQLSLIGARAQACRTWSPSVQLGACAGPLVQRLTGTAPRLTDPQTSSQWLWGATASAVVRSVEPKRFGWWAELGLEWRKDSVALNVERKDKAAASIGQFPQLGALLLAGAELSF